MEFLGVLFCSVMGWWALILGYRELYQEGVHWGENDPVRILFLYVFVMPYALILGIRELWRMLRRKMGWGIVEWREVVGGLYVLIAYIVGILAFIGCWFYCITQYGFLIGVSIGWFPSAIVGFFAGSLWGLWALLVIVLVMLW